MYVETPRKLKLLEELIVARLIKRLQKEGSLLVFQNSPSLDSRLNPKTESNLVLFYR